ncbi:MAG: ABC transporter ATP-binding protein [Dysgonamonadaceae bacterium]|jgi:ABC-2 type transport system ATP-binding protein|nr:ABC transporter ATP-binding protein [Dysgonamonadaceae bacterium]
MILEVQNISKRYGTQQAVGGVTFSVARGEIVGFLGLNGAGKTTTMQMIAGSLPPDTGQVRIAGVDLRQEPVKARFSIGFLPEDNPLYGEMYVAEYLEYVAGLYALKDAKERVKEVIRQTGLSPEAHKKIEQLSKGYKQRTGLAQAIIHQPRLLLLDEPAAGLDPEQTGEIHSLLLALSENRGILLSTHSLAEAAAVCTRILFIHKGKIAGDYPEKEIKDLEALFKERTKTHST